MTRRVRGGDTSASGMSRWRTMIGGSDGHARVVGGPWSIGKMLMLDDKGVIDDVESLQLLGVPG